MDGDDLDFLERRRRERVGLITLTILFGGLLVLAVWRGWLPVP